MVTLSINTLATIVEAKNVNDEFYHTDITGFAIDSRQIKHGQIFVALKGENTNGHDFVKQAQYLGAVAAIVEHINHAISLPQIQVEDTIHAFAKIAQWWREQHQLNVISVCGSNGKTTVKNCLLTALSHIKNKSCIHATQGNFNNHLGVPLTLLDLTDKHQIAVIEMAANHMGEILPLTQITQPDIAIITNSGYDHIEGFGSVEGSARTNGEVFAAMKSGVAVLNADDAFFPLWQEQAKHLNVISFGYNGNADVMASQIATAISQSTFMVSYQQQQQKFILKLPGRHNVSNALAVTAALLSLGETLQDIANALTMVEFSQGRISILEGFNGCKIIDDTYNANPSSLEAALDYLKQMGGKSWLILGDMAELGEESVVLHTAAGNKAKQTGVTTLLTYGEFSQCATAAFGQGATHFTSMSALINHIISTAKSADTLLIKGSRSMQMERVVEACC